jgi:hypothetical protein
MHINTHQIVRFAVLTWLLIPALVMAAGQSANFSLNGQLENSKNGVSPSFDMEIQNEPWKVGGESPSFQIINNSHFVASSSSSSSSSSSAPGVILGTGGGDGGSGGCRTNDTCPDDGGTDGDTAVIGDSSGVDAGGIGGDDSGNTGGTIGDTGGDDNGDIGGVDGAIENAGDDGSFFPAPTVEPFVPVIIIDNASEISNQFNYFGYGSEAELRNAYVLAASAMNCGPAPEHRQCTHQNVCKELLDEYAPACSDVAICVLDHDCTASLQANDEAFNRWLAHQRTTFHASASQEFVRYYIGTAFSLLVFMLALYALFFTHRKLTQSSLL